MHPTSLTVDVAVIRAHVDDLSRRSTGIVDDGRSQLRGPRSSLPRPGQIQNPMADPPHLERRALRPGKGLMTIGAP